MKIEFKYNKRVNEEDTIFVFLIMLMIAFFGYGIWIGIILDSPAFLFGLTVGAFFIIAFLVEPISKIRVRILK